MASTSITAARAQGVTELEGVTIYSANRTPTDASKVGSSVEVLTEKDFEKQSKTFLKDYLEQLPGVSFRQNGPPGTQAGISLRGAAGRYVKVLVDGIDISDPSGVVTDTHFEQFLVGDVSRIEVLKGSQSTLYGGDAVGGVISIETKAAKTPGFSQSGAGEYGAYNTFRGAYTAGYAAQNGSNISLTAQGINTDGFSAASVGSEDDGYKNLTLSGRGEYYLSPSMKIFFAARTLESKSNYDGFPPPAFKLGDTADYGEMAQHAGRVGTEFSLLNGAFQNTFAVQGMKITRDEHSDNPSWSDGDRVKGEYKGVLTFNNRLSLLAGADWEQTGVENSNISNRITADIGGVYGQLMMEPIDGLVLTGGGRIDDHSDFGRFNTYRLTAAYLIPGTETKFRGSVATGFRAPALDELFGAYPAFGLAYYGNPNLKPEESESWDAGIEQGFLSGRFKLAATYFELDTENLIAFVGACTPAEPCMQNVAGITHREGVELSASALVTDRLAITAGYTYIETETATGARLNRVPGNVLVIGFDAKPIDRVEINVTGQYVADTLERAKVKLDDYFLVSAKASYEFTPGWKAYVRGENLLDEDYETILDYGTAGASVYGGVTMAMPSN